MTRGARTVLWQAAGALVVAFVYGLLVYLLASCSSDGGAADDAGGPDGSFLESRSDAGAESSEAGPRPDGKCGGCYAADKSCRPGTDDRFCGAGGLACADVTGFACTVGTPDESVRDGCERREYPCTRRGCDGQARLRCCFRTESLPKDGRPACRDLP